MSYFVVAQDGQKYGPADLAVLNQWAVEGRLSPDSMLEDAATGARLSASRVPGLMLAVQQPSATNLPPMTADPGPRPATGQYQVPGVDPLPSSPYQQQDWSRAPGVTGSSPYPRGMGLSGDLPLELKGKFNWGAFLLNWIWGLNHKAYLTLLIWPVNILGRYVPFGGLAGLGLCIWFGFMGNEWAWKSGRFQSIEHFREVQRVWTVWGAVLALFGIVLCGVGLLLLGVSTLH